MLETTYSKVWLIQATRNEYELKTDLFLQLFMSNLLRRKSMFTSTMMCLGEMAEKKLRYRMICSISKSQTRKRYVCSENSQLFWLRHPIAYCRCWPQLAKSSRFSVSVSLPTCRTQPRHGDSRIKTNVKSNFLISEPSTCNSTTGHEWNRKVPPAH